MPEHEIWRPFWKSTSVGYSAHPEDLNRETFRAAIRYAVSEDY